MKYNLFIGRWSPFHNGHKTIIDSFLKNGRAVCVAIRDTDEMYPVLIRHEMIRAVYEEEYKSGLLKIIVIPDIEQVCIGRKVGYSLVEVPEKIQLISGTEIRESLGAKEQGKHGWIKLPKVVKRIIEVYENEQGR
jgi:adenylylsulfate kinase